VDKGRSTWLLRKVVATGSFTDGPASTLAALRGASGSGTSAASGSGERHPSRTAARAPAALGDSGEGGGGNTSPRIPSFLTDGEAPARRVGSRGAGAAPFAGGAGWPPARQSSGSPGPMSGTGTRNSQAFGPPHPQHGTPRAASLDTLAALRQASGSYPPFGAGGAGPSALRIRSGSAAAGSAGMQPLHHQGSGMHAAAAGQAGGSSAADALMARAQFPPIRTAPNPAGALPLSLSRPARAMCAVPHRRCSAANHPSAGFARALPHALHRNPSPPHTHTAHEQWSDSGAESPFLAGTIVRQASDLSALSRDGGAGSPGPAFLNNSFIGG
jgi:hypothetical protein